MDKRWGSKHIVSSGNTFTEWQTQPCPWEESKVFGMLHRDLVLTTGPTHYQGTLGAHWLLFWVFNSSVEPSPSVTARRGKTQPAASRRTQGQESLKHQELPSPVPITSHPWTGLLGGARLWDTTRLLLTLWLLSFCLQAVLPPWKSHLLSLTFASLNVTGGS